MLLSRIIDGRERRWTMDGTPLDLILLLHGVELLMQVEGY